ncbi:MAG TPA: DNA polymerase Y family protein [Xanthobacteraceae bacterium]|nr:DNA polymerase Y family protein [Xanthobacteraceae bacterium]
MPSQRRYLSLWLRRLATDRIAKRCFATSRLAHNAAYAPGEPLVITRLIKGSLRIVAMDDAAQSLGLRPGMPLADARAMYPTLAIAENDEEADRHLINAVADWCDRYTPLVGLAAPDGLMLDITGCAHLFGGEAAMWRDILVRLADQGLHARAAIADTVGCAFAVARFGDTFLVPPGGARHALAPLPMAALRLAPEIVEALAGLGLKRIADIIDLPRAPLAARFGEILVRRLDQALGRADEPITPRLPVPSYVAEQSFPDPIGRERDVLGTIARLAARLEAAMERRQDGARLLQTALFRTDNKIYRIEVGTSAPVRNAALIARLFADRLAVIGEACDPGFGFDIVRLTVLVTEHSDPMQRGLGQKGGMRDEFLQDGFGCLDDEVAFSHLIDRLGARFGPRRITRLVEQDTHIPEFAVAALPAHSVPTPLHAHNHRVWLGASSPSPRLRGEGRCEGARTRGEAPSPTLPSPASGGGKGGGDLSAQAGRGEKQDSLSPTRPVRLFGWPEPVEVIAEVPDGPPARFRWRHVLHEVAAAEGPERIAMEWWRDTDGQKPTRDYFRVESREGLRAWLYREGRYDDATPAPRWFLHGLFG